MKEGEFTNTIFKNDPSKMRTKSTSKMSLFGCLTFTVPGESTLTMTSDTTYQIKQTKTQEAGGKNVIETSKGTIIRNGTFSYKFITEDTQMKTTIEYSINSGSSSGNTAIMEIIYKDNSNIVLTNEYIREDKEEER